MRKTSYEFLLELLRNPSPSGFEGPARAVYRDYTSRFADEVHTDVMGNTFAILNANGSPRVMLAGHIDEIGIMISHITEKGFLRFRTIGGWDPLMLVGQRVAIQTAKGAVYGVIGRTPIHLLEPTEREKAPKVKQLFIDIGAKDGKSAKKMVEVGDSGVLMAEPLQLTKNRIAVRGADDRLGAFVVAEALRIVAENKERLKAAVYSVASVQEEVGLRGARTAAFGVEPDVGVAVDVTFATDYPGADPARTGDVKLGGGPSITKGANINPKVFSLLAAAAKKRRLKYQTEGAPGGTGTDANVIQLTRAGVATGLLSVPLRYMHSPIEVFDPSDLTACATLLAEFVLSLKPRMDFTP